MKKIMLIFCIVSMLLISPMVSINAYELNSIKSQDSEPDASPGQEPFDGYILYCPWLGYITYLINNTGEIVHKWNSLHQPGLGIRLLENGNLLRADFLVNPIYGVAYGCTGRVEEYSWSGVPLWKYVYSTDQYYMHHDIEPLPNGNLLIVAWEGKTQEEAINAGRDPSLLQENRSFWPDYLIEVKPNGINAGEIVWEWHSWDHIIQDFNQSKDNYGDVATHPELIDINIGAYIDWLHINSIDYNEELDQILLSINAAHEIWIIDHSTTSEEAAGHTGGRYGKGGDLLYRWGNSRNYRVGNWEDRLLFAQHDARWIEPGYPGEGHITIFNNHHPDGSTVFEIVTPIDSNGNYYLEQGSAYGPEEPIWSFTCPESSCDMSAARRIPNGNTLVLSGREGIIWEVTPEKNIIWTYENKFPFWSPDDKRVFSFHYYPPDYPGIKIPHNSRDVNPIEKDNTRLLELILSNLFKGLNLRDIFINFFN